MLVTDVIDRLQTQVPVLDKRCEGAAQFADLMKRNALPQVTPAAFVLPLGLQGGKAESATGVFTQMINEAIGVMLIVRSHDRTGAKALETIGNLIREIVEAVIGWEPNDEVGVFQLSKAHLVSMDAGTLVYQIDFTISDQWRV